MVTVTNHLPHLSWKESDIDSSLTALARYVETEAQRQIDWYRSKQVVKARVSTAIRFTAIVLFAAGALVPIMKATLKVETLRKLAFDFADSGYLLIAVAGACVAMDRFFGYSSGWIRCITTALAIEKSLDEFRMEWARSLAKLRGAAPDEAKLDQLILTCETFSVATRSQVEQETKAWVMEFQTNLAQLQRDLQARADAVKARMNP
jgi:hypothetical protein